MKKQTSKQRKEDRKTGVINQVRKETRRKEGSEDRRKEVRDSLLEVTLALWLSFHCWHSDSVQICRRGRSTHELQVNVGRVSSATQPPLTVSTCLHGATEDYSSIKKKVCFVFISRRLTVTSQNMWAKQDELRGRDTARLQSERQKEIWLYLVHQGSLSTNGARIENWSVLSYLLRVVHY